MNIAVCDDDEGFIGFIQKQLTEYSAENNCDFEVFTFSGSKPLFDCDRKFDIAILNVQMPYINGIDLGVRLREKNRRVALMYITSDKNCLDEALNLNAARFFEKPIDPKRFHDGLDSIIKRIDDATVKIFVKEKNKIVRIDSDDIIYIEIEQTGHRKTKVITENGAYISSNKMSFWEDRLISSVFVRTHKSYMVNLKHVTKYEYNCFELSGKYTVPISRSYQASVRKQFVRFTLG